METENQVTEKTVKERLAEAELIRDYMVRFFDDRMANLKSALEGQTETLDDSQHVLEGLNWSRGKKDKSFEWCFNTSKEGDQLPETKDAATLIEGAKDHKLTIGGYRYELSVDRKFLSRRRASR
jgi:hypothetical protein